MGHRRATEDQLEGPAGGEVRTMTEAEWFAGGGGGTHGRHRRLAHAELRLEDEGKELFTAPRGNQVSGSDRPYWLGFLATTPRPEPEK